MPYTTRTILKKALGLTLAAYAANVIVTGYCAVFKGYRGIQQHEHYMSDKGKSYISRIMDLGGIEEKIAQKGGTLSPYELIHEAHMSICRQVEYDYGSCTIDDIMDGKANCFAYSGSVYAIVLSAAEKHPQLSDIVRRIRWNNGVADGEDDSLHAWIGFMGPDKEWHNYETTLDMYHGIPQSDSKKQSRCVDQMDYRTINYYAMDNDGVVRRHICWSNVIVPAQNLGGCVLKSIEDHVGINVSGKIKKRIPRTALLVLCALGIARGSIYIGRWTCKRVSDYAGRLMGD